MKLFNFCLISSLAIILSGCEANQQGQKSTKPTEKVHKVQVRSLKPADNQILKEKDVVTTQMYTGTVKYYSMEGGFFGIVTEWGDKFLPMNLPKEYRQDGAIIKFSGQRQTDVMTIQQWGSPFQIDKVELIKAGTGAGGAEI